MECKFVKLIVFFLFLNNHCAYGLKLYSLSFKCNNFVVFLIPHIEKISSCVLRTVTYYGSSHRKINVSKYLEIRKYSFIFKFILIVSMWSSTLFVLTYFTYFMMSHNYWYKIHCMHTNLNHINPITWYRCIIQGIYQIITQIIVTCRTSFIIQSKQLYRISRGFIYIQKPIFIQWNINL